jgi:hypothetical protein
MTSRAKPLASGSTCGRVGFKSNLSVPMAVGGSVMCAPATGTFREFRARDEETIGG